MAESKNSNGAKAFGGLMAVGLVITIVFGVNRIQAIQIAGQKEDLKLAKTDFKEAVAAVEVRFKEAVEKLDVKLQIEIKGQGDIAKESRDRAEKNRERLYEHHTDPRLHHARIADLEARIKALERKRAP